MPRLIGSRTNPALKASTAAEAALASLIGPPAPIEEAQPLTSAERLAAILQRARQITHPVANPLQRDFFKFLTEECWTKDESRGGVVRLIPAYPYIKEICDAFVECPLLFIEKSRRVMASWICCCFDIWIAAGGQDERWPVLMHSIENRQVLLASRKLKDAQGSAWFLRNRVKFIVQQAELHNIKERWPSFPTWEWVETEARASNGSLITAIASGADQARGVGCTFAHCEEVAHWDDAEATIQSMIPTLQGGGHLCAISTPAARTYAHRIVTGTLKNPEALYDNTPLYDAMFDDGLDDADDEGGI